MKVGILGAMDAEIQSVVSQIEGLSVEKVGSRQYHSGKWYGKDVVAVTTGWGKVAAATASAVLIERYNVDKIIFFGVGGAVDAQLNIGDIVVASDLVQYDLDPSPIFPKYQIPFLGMSRIKADEKLVELSVRVCGEFAETISDEISAESLARFGITRPGVFKGLIGSGDQFITDAAVKHALLKEFADLKCIEMEGAAVAQVCVEAKVPFCVIRVVSDKADGDAEMDFGRFLSEVIQLYGKDIVGGILSRL